jgi:hypothetical protein
MTVLQFKQIWAFNWQHIHRGRWLCPLGRSLTCEFIPTLCFLGCKVVVEWNEETKARKWEWAQPREPAFW